MQRSGSDPKESVTSVAKSLGGYSLRASDLRYDVGSQPCASRNARTKLLRLAKPAWRAISSTVIEVALR